MYVLLSQIGVSQGLKPVDIALQSHWFGTAEACIQRHGFSSLITWTPGALGERVGERIAPAESPRRRWPRNRCQLFAAPARSVLQT